MPCHAGDIESNFEELQVQIKVAQNTALSGIDKWTTDIGGYQKGNPTTPYFRELIVRWFQFGACACACVCVRTKHRCTTNAALFQPKCANRLAFVHPTTNNSVQPKCAIRLAFVYPTTNNSVHTYARTCGTALVTLLLTFSRRLLPALPAPRRPGGAEASSKRMRCH